MSGYPSCILTCTFLLQRSDAATLNASAPAVIFLQAKHLSLDGGGDRYFVMEHRYVLTPRRFGASRDANSNPNVPVLTVHLRDIDPTGGSLPFRSHPLGHSILTDCTPRRPPPGTTRVARSGAASSWTRGAQRRRSWNRQRP